MHKHLNPMERCCVVKACHISFCLHHAGFSTSHELSINELQVSNGILFSLQTRTFCLSHVFASRFTYISDHFLHSFNQCEIFTFLLRSLLTDETGILVAVHFSMKTLTSHVIYTAPWGRATSMSASNVLCLLRSAWCLSCWNHCFEGSSSDEKHYLSLMQTRSPSGFMNM